MLEFIENLDYLHTYMMSDYPDIKMPSFSCEPNSQTDRMTLHYYSHRNGLHMLVAGNFNYVYRSSLCLCVRQLAGLSLEKRSIQNIIWHPP